MKKKPLETVATVVLAVMCAGLIFHLAVRVRDVHAGAPAAAVPEARGPIARLQATTYPEARPAAAPDDPEGPALDVALYTRLQSRTLPPPDRDPFSFEPTAAQVANARQTAAARAIAAPSGPPPPPPLPFEAVGFTVNAEGRFEAYLADNQQVYVVHAGDEFDKNYRVISITPAMIEIQDESGNRTVELPFPQ